MFVLILHSQNVQHILDQSLMTARAPHPVLNPTPSVEEGPRSAVHGKKEKKARRSGKSPALNICSPFWPS